MTTALYTEIARRKVQDLSFYSTRFALWFHQNMRFATIYKSLILIKTIQ